MHLKILASLKRKYGPLPLWVWTLIVGGAGALWWRYRHPSSAAGAPADQTAALQDALAYGPPDTGAAAGGGDLGGAAGAGTTGLTPEEIQQLLQQGPGETKLESDLQALLEQLQSGGVPGGDTGAGTDTGATGGTDTSAPDTGAGASISGVNWGGATFYTKQALARFLSATNRGLNASQAYAIWAKRHPAAAATLAGAPPKPPRKPPARKPPKPSGRTGSRKPPRKGAGAPTRTRRPPARGSRGKPAQPPRRARPRRPPARRPPRRPPPRGGRRR